MKYYQKCTVKNGHSQNLQHLWPFRHPLSHYSHTHLSSECLWLAHFLVHRTHTQHWYGTQCWAAGLNRNKRNCFSPRMAQTSPFGLYSKHSVRHFYTWSLCHLTLQQEGVGGSANINLLNVIICGYRVVTDDKPRDVAGRGNMGDCPCHPNVVRTHPSKLQVGGNWNDWKSKGLKKKKKL